MATRTASFVLAGFCRLIADRLDLHADLALVDATKSEGELFRRVEPAWTAALAIRTALSDIRLRVPVAQIGSAEGALLLFPSRMIDVPELEATLEGWEKINGLTCDGYESFLQRYRALDTALKLLCGGKMYKGFIAVHWPAMIKG